MPGLRYTALPGRVLIDSADRTFDYLNPKILVTSNLTKTIQNVGFDENLLLDVNIVNLETTLDTRYIKRSPSGENQTIQPLTDNVPLILKNKAGGASDLLQLIDSTGKMRIRVDFVSDIFLSNVVVTETGLDATSTALSLQLSGELNPRYILRGDGSYALGPGATAVDTIMQRTGVGIFQITLNPTAPATPASLSLLGTEILAAERRIRENAGALELTDSTPTVLRSVITRGAANVALPMGATLAFITFATSEPDTNYEISVIAAYNTTVSYSAKAVTGFTILFGTAAPAGGSTFDWHIERISRT